LMVLEKTGQKTTDLRCNIHRALRNTSRSSRDDNERVLEVAAQPNERTPAGAAGTTTRRSRGPMGRRGHNHERGHQRGLGQVRRGHSVKIRKHDSETPKRAHENPRQERQAEQNHHPEHHLNHRSEM